MNDGKNSAFQGRRLIDCVRRIYEDVLKVWNFNDPSKLLSNDYFFSLTLKVTEEFTPGNNQDDWLSNYSDVVSLASAVGATLAQVLGGIGIGILAIKHLYRVYQAVPLTAQYLGAYIVDLTLILHRLFLNTLPMEPPRRLTKELIDSEVHNYLTMDCKEIHSGIRKLTPMNCEQEIGNLIRDSLG